MKKFLNDLKPRNLVEGLVLALSMILIISTIVLVLANQQGLFNPASKQGDIKLEAYQTTPTESNLADATKPSTPSEMTQGSGWLAAVREEVPQGIDYWKQMLVDRTRSFGDRTSQRLNSYLDFLTKILNQGQSLQSLEPNVDIASEIEREPEGLAIAEPVLPPAVEEPQTLVTNPPQAQTPALPSASQGDQANWNSPYAPTAPSQAGQSDANIPRYAPVAPTNSPNASNNAGYAPTAPQANAPSQLPNQYAPAPPVNQNPGEASPTANTYAPDGNLDPQKSPTTMPSAQEINQVEASIFAMINSAREAAGLHTLQLNGTIQAIADHRAIELSQYYHPKHYRADGSHALNWIAVNWGANYGMGENIGWIDNVRSLNAKVIFDAFYNSGKGHREIMLHPDIYIGGVGIYCVPGPVADNNTGSPNDTNKGRIFICMNFGR